MSLPNMASKKDIINALTLGDAQQVNLHVRVLEVNRTAGRELGINWILGPVSIEPARAKVCRRDRHQHAEQHAHGGRRGHGHHLRLDVANVLKSGSLGNVDVIINALERKGSCARWQSRT